MLVAFAYACTASVYIYVSGCGGGRRDILIVVAALSRINS
jgi:hypothetical protein